MPTLQENGNDDAAPTGSQETPATSGHPGDSFAAFEALMRLVSIAQLGEHGVIWIGDQILAGGPFAAWYPAFRPQLPELRVTLHADGLKGVAGEEARALSWLIETGRQAFGDGKRTDIEAQATRCRGEHTPDWAARLKVLGSNVRSRFMQGPYVASLRPDWDAIRTPEQPSAGILDLRLHENEERHVFVTLDPALLDVGLTPERAKKSFVVKPTLAQRFVDLYLKANGEYRPLPNYKANRGLYYWMRLWTLVPSFGHIWSYAVFGHDVAPRGPDIRDFMHNLYARLIGMMQAHDRIGWLRYTPATNDTRDEMLNQLNYFIVLATGVFDSIAWLGLHRFGLAIPKSRMGVTIRTKGQATSPFLENLRNAAGGADLATYLSDLDRQARIALFYGPRDSIQHRLVLTGAHFNTGQYLSDCNVVFPDDDTAQAIYAIDRHDPELVPFSVWGLIYAGREEDRPLLEPYRFSGAALTFVLAVVDGALERLDLGSWLSPYPQRKEAATRADLESTNRPIFSVPFP